MGRSAGTVVVKPALVIEPAAGEAEGIANGTVGQGRDGVCRQNSVFAIGLIAISLDHGTGLIG